MASALYISNDVAHDQADVVNTKVSSGILRIYSNSTTKPANANTALDGAAVVLAAITLPASTSNTVSSAGVLTFGSITTVQGSATGTASYFRVFQSDGTTVVFDGNVGLTADTPDLVLDNTTITSGEDVAITSFTYTITQ
jgi:hypothetical protein